MTTQQPEALQLAFECEESAFHWANEIDTRAKAAKLLRAQQARIAELERWQEDVRSNSPLLAELQRANARVQELEASQAQRVPLDAYKLREIFKKLNENHDEEGWNFADLVREVEEYHGITNQKCSGCSGVGLVGGLTQDGYVSDECPFCKGSGIDNGITQEKQG